MLLTLTELTFVDCDDYEIVRQGYNARHGHFYLYVFDVKEVIRYSTSKQPTTRIAIYYSQFPSLRDQLQIITAYPYELIFKHSSTFYMIVLFCFLFLIRTFFL